MSSNEMKAKPKFRKKGPSSYCCNFFWFYTDIVFYLHDSADAVPFTVSSDRFTVLHINCNFLNYYNKYFDDDDDDYDDDDVFTYLYISI